jgi:hypothetical protein
MTWFEELRRRLSALLGWLRRPREGATAQRSLLPAPVDPAIFADKPAKSAVAIAGAMPRPPERAGVIVDGPTASRSTASAPKSAVAKLVVAPATASALASGSQASASQASASQASASQASASELQASASASSASQASASQASASQASASKPGPAQSGPVLDPSLGQIKVRQFFARMIAATPAGMTIDFVDWRSASVERFFMAMTSPGLTRRREAPTSGGDQLSLTNAFQGFEWD